MAQACPSCAVPEILTASLPQLVSKLTDSLQWSCWKAACCCLGASLLGPAAVRVATFKRVPLAHQKAQVKVVQTSTSHPCPEAYYKKVRCMLGWAGRPGTQSGSLAMAALTLACLTRSLLPQKRWLRTAACLS